MLKHLLHLSTLLLTLSAGSAAWADEEPSLVGTWILEKSDNPLPDGQVVPYCTGVHGFIVYTAEGYVTVSLNCDPEGPTPEPADVSGRKFFYAGTYVFDGRKVTHSLLNASQPELIGQSFSRIARLNGTRLTLTGENQGQVFTAIWQRLGQPNAEQESLYRTLQFYWEGIARGQDGGGAFDTIYALPIINPQESNIVDFVLRRYSSDDDDAGASSDPESVLQSREDAAVADFLVKTLDYTTPDLNLRLKEALYAVSAKHVFYFYGSGDSYEMVRLVIIDDSDNVISLWLLHVD